jgi:hypothetical protein
LNHLYCRRGGRGGLGNLKTLAAEHGASISGDKGENRLDLALRADGLGLRAASSGNLRLGCLLHFRGIPVRPARLTSPGRIAKLPVGEEELFSSAKDEVVVAVCTTNNFVYVIHCVPLHEPNR